MAKSTFGERLRREREMRGVGLEEIANATRISTRFLQALEQEQWERLPGGIFNRGFVRAVARYLGLDEEGLVAEYAQATDDHPEVAVWADRGGSAWSRYLPLVVLLAVVAGLAGGGWFVYAKYGQAIKTWWVARAPKPASGAATTADSRVSPPTPPAPAAAGESAAAPETLELKVEAGNPTVLTIVADGKTVFDGPMAAGQSERFPAKEQFEVSVRNPLDILVELNGQTLPPLGPPGQPAKTILTRKDLKPAGGQD